MFQMVSETPIVLLLGFIVVLTGLVHVFEGFRTGPAHQRQRELDTRPRLREDRHCAGAT